MKFQIGLTNQTKVSFVDRTCNSRMVQKERKDYKVFTVNAEEKHMKEIEAIDTNIFHNMTDEAL